MRLNIWKAVVLLAAFSLIAGLVFSEPIYTAASLYVFGVAVVNTLNEKQ